MPGSAVHVLVTLLQLYSYVILARVIVSWIPNLSLSNPFVQLLHSVTEPVLAPVRRVIPPLGMMDISPIVVFIALQILQRILLGMAG